MNEPIANSRFILTKPLFLEGIRRVHAQSMDRAARFLLLALAGVWAVFAAVTWLRGGAMGFVLVQLPVLALVALWIVVLLPRSRAKQAYRSYIAKYGEDTERETEFFSDRLHVSAGGRETDVLYRDIRHTLRTKHLLIFLTEDKTGILVPENSFESGSAALVLRRIEECRAEQPEPAEEPEEDEEQPEKD